ncbi:MerR family transcriptional regulator [Streptomyces sp. NPDC046324]|uniref:MerR family transcriptional regulator n=1 Tax=Streptomyces sp. NPDC046324 TaxID=3154915 RepID=UPI0033E4552F
MDSDTLYSNGELSRRTGLTVKTIRFYSDRGIVPPTDRSPAGYRLYGPDALARLDLARTLRELGIDLATVRKVLDREASLSEVTQAHADALDVQIRTLRLRRALLRAVAGRGHPTPLEMDLMHRIAGHRYPGRAISRRPQPPVLGSSPAATAASASVASRRTASRIWLRQASRRALATCGGVGVDRVVAEGRAGLQPHEHQPVVQSRAHRLRTRVSDVPQHRDGLRQQRVGGPRRPRRRIEPGLEVVEVLRRDPPGRHCRRVGSDGRRRTRPASGRPGRMPAPFPARRFGDRRSPSTGSPPPTRVRAGDTPRR